MRNRTIYRSVIATLLRSGRRDLAESVAKEVVVAWGDIIGKTVFGKEAQVRCFDGLLKAEQYPPGGKTRGVLTGVAELSWWRPALKEDGRVYDEVHTIMEAAKTAPWTKITGMMMAAFKRLKPTESTLNLQFKKQKAVRAPTPTPKLGTMERWFTNKHQVAVSIERDAVRLKDLTDKNNEPAAFTQGPKAYKKALETIGDWRDLSMHDIMDAWNKSGIKYHYYMAMD